MSVALHAKIVGPEDYVYVWTLGAEGLGDGQDKLVTVDANPASPGYGTVVHRGVSGGRDEAAPPAHPTSSAVWIRPNP